MKYLIKDTTKEERKKIVKNALGIAVADRQVPSDYVIELAQKYINGEMELEQVREEVIKKYKEN